MNFSLSWLTSSMTSGVAAGCIDSGTGGMLWPPRSPPGAVSRRSPMPSGLIRAKSARGERAEVEVCAVAAAAQWARRPTSMRSVTSRVKAFDEVPSVRASSLKVASTER
jgi:hypothetical protein